MTNAGNTSVQYLLAVSAKANSTVPMIISNCPLRMIHLGLISLDSGPVKLMANASMPRGIL